ncbi:LptF/LptG family permease [Algoriphagus boritolerans]|uniref:LptF/LptG family permease n=1 Tax=Algoriphagus boritolerans TaxID=308111 RepID=UPI000AB32F3D
MDSIYTLVNDLKFQNYQTAESIYPFFTKNRKLSPPEEIKKRKELDDAVRKSRIQRERKKRDSLERLKTKSDSAVVKRLDSLQNRELKINVAATSQPLKTDSIFKRKLSRNSLNKNSVDSSTKLITSVDTTGKEIPKKNPRTTPLTPEEKALIDSVIFKRGYISNALTMSLNNSRNLKNTFNVKMTQIENHEREFRRYEIAWYQKYTQAIACFVMFLIGAPLGSIIKKGGLGMPVLISIIFFILFYMLTITGEKWAKEGVTDSFFWDNFLQSLSYSIWFVLFKTGKERRPTV